MPNLDTLNIKITADVGDSKQKLKQLEKNLKESAEKVQQLRAELKELDDMGFDGDQVQSYAEKLDKAEEEWIAAAKAVDEYKESLDEANDSMEDMGDSAEMEASAILGALSTSIEMVKKTIQALEDLSQAYVDAYDYTGEQAAYQEKIKDNWTEIKGLFINEDFLNAMASFTSWLKDLAKKIKGVDDSFEKTTASTNEWLGSLDLIEAEVKDLDSYWSKINKTITKSLQLISGFDELNKYSKQSEDSNGLSDDEKADLQEYLNELYVQQFEIQSQINKIWSEYAKTIGISASEYEELWSAYRLGDQEKFEQLCEQLGIDLDDATASMKNFASTGYPAIQTLKSEFDELADSIKEVIALMAAAGVDTSTATFQASEAEEGAMRKKRSEAYSTAQLTGTDTTGKAAAENGKDLISLSIEEIKNRKGGWATSWTTNADGGVYTSPTLGMVAEYSGASSNPEIISPVDMMYDTVVAANGQLASVMAQVGNSIVSAVNNQSMEVKIGDDVIAQSARRGNKAYYNRTGSYLI